MYDINTALISAILFITMLMAIELGYRIGDRFKSKATESSKAHVNAIQASLLGVLALLLGFTFSLSLQRFDSRSNAVVDEANAMGTAYLRVDLLHAETQEQARQLMRQYIDNRASASKITLVDREGRQNSIAEARQLQTKLWKVAQHTLEFDDKPTTTGLFIQALNQMFDSLESRNEALNRHVPEIVLLLLYITFLMAGTIVGYAAGVSQHRASFSTYIMVGLIVLLVFVIVDLDRPRRGLIEVNQQSIYDLQQVVFAETRDEKN